ncbi:MAG: hypothetical protein K0R09_2003 [Clostridiales bacterium]|jgi:hypothetical protein|nr:hypothetical protein [Clostridiales bacterium]
MKDKPIIREGESNRTDDVELSQIDEKNIDVYQPEGMKYPIMERLNNGLTWPEGGPKGRIDLMETYEVSSVPRDPGTPLESVRFLEKKGVMPK